MAVFRDNIVVFRFFLYLGEEVRQLYFRQKSSLNAEKGVVIVIVIVVEHLRQKALHTFFSLRRHTDFNKLKPSIACKIFDSKILPILTYNSEVWGAFVKSDFKSWDLSPIEKTHLRFCKRYLEVHNKASNIACRAKHGKFPLINDKYEGTKLSKLPTPKG